MSNFAAAASEDLGSLIKQALGAHQQGKVEEALAGYEKVAPLLGGTSEQIQATIHSNLGALYMQQAEYEKAQSSFKAAATAQPSNVSLNGYYSILLAS